MNSLSGPVMQLIRAALQPLASPARARADDPVCRVVITAVNADLKAGGLDHVTQLVTGAGMAASGLTFWLAKERGVKAEVLISQLTVGLSEGIPERDVVKMIETMLTGPPGVKQTADFLARLFDEDEERYYDLIVALGRYSASCIGMLSALGISSEEDTLEDLDDTLQDFYAS